MVGKTTRFSNCISCMHMDQVWRSIAWSYAVALSQRSKTFGIIFSENISLSSREAILESKPTRCAEMLTVLRWAHADRKSAIVRGAKLHYRQSGKRLTLPADLATKLKLKL